MLDLHKTASGGTAGQFLLELSPPSPQRGVMGVIHFSDYFCHCEVDRAMLITALAHRNI